MRTISDKKCFYHVKKVAHNSIARTIFATKLWLCTAPAISPHIQLKLVLLTWHSKAPRAGTDDH
jgi:hypothetical protein